MSDADDPDASFTDDSDTELRLWRNYAEGKVGYQIEGRERLLLSPAETREKADALDRAKHDLPAEYREQVEDQIETMRSMAHEVEQASNE